MILLLLFSFLVTCGLISVIFFSKGDASDTRAGKGHSEPPVPLAPAVTVLLESENEKLHVKWKKLKEEHKKLEEELAAAKGSEAALAEELQKTKSWIDRDKVQEESIKKELYAFKDTLVKKDQEYEKEFSSNVSLKKELGEYKQKCEMLDNAHRQNSEKIRILEAQNTAYKEEQKSHFQIIAELKKKNEDIEWVSKKEYDELKAKLAHTRNDEKSSAA